MEQACFLITLVKLNPKLNNSTTKDMYHLFALLWFWFKLSVTAGSYSENKENLAPVCYSSTLPMTTLALQSLLCSSRFKVRKPNLWMGSEQMWW